VNIVEIQVKTLPVEVET